MSLNNNNTEISNADALRLAQFCMNKAPTGIFWLNSKGEFVFSNERAFEILGYTQEELFQCKLWDIDIIYSEKKWLKDWNKYLIAEDDPPVYESYFKRKDGSLFTAEVVSKHHVLDGKEFMVAFVRDISKRRRALEKLKESEERFRIIFEHAAVGIAQIETLSSKFIRINKTYCDILGYTQQEIVKKSFIEITHPDDIQEDLDNMEKMKSGEIRDFSMEKRYFKKDGSTVWVTLSVSPMWEEGEKPTHHIAIVKDITLRKKADEAIRKSEESLKETNKTKDKLFSIISHDLRNPFQSILGMSGMLDERYDSMTEETIKAFIQEINKSSKRAYFLLDNLLNWAREQRGRIVIHKDKLRANDLVSKSISPLSILAKRKNISLVKNVPEELELFADENTIQTTITNLVSNAIKFTPKDGTIQVEAYETYENVEIKIKDSGIGMSSEKVNSILTSNEYTSTTGTDNESGTGLGLQLCKEFVKKNDGSLSIQSEIGKGSTFCITLPKS